MNKQTKYFVLTKYTTICFFVNLLLGFLERTLKSLNLFRLSIMNPIYDLIGVTKVLLVIATVLGALTLIYLVINYYGSKFYRDYKINAFEAMYHGFMGIYQIYDKLYSTTRAQDVQVDFKHSTVYFKTSEGYFCVKYLDLYGKVEGKQDSEFWASVSKPKTRYNQKVYTKKIKFPNPYRENQEYIDTLKSKTKIQYTNLVVISGFYKLSHNVDAVLAPYKILDIM